jgi:hypothetical protein
MTLPKHGRQAAQWISIKRPLSQSMKASPGIGASGELSLRVSVATLVRVVFGPEDGEQVLVLERKATYHAADGHVTVKAQPFGGAVRINDVARIEEVTGGFRFDSDRSRREQDFRILIHPSAWEAVKAFCLNQFQASEEAAFETSPVRELAEELHDSLGIEISPDQYASHPLWTVLENKPASTGNIHAGGQPTVRVYRVFEAHILDPGLEHQMAVHSESISDTDLRQLAWEDRRKGGKGRANACLVLPVESLHQLYGSLSPIERSATIHHAGTTLEDTVFALWEDHSNSKYQYVKD